MDKSLKVAKLNIEDMRRPILIFYSAILAYLLFITRWTVGSDKIVIASIEIFTMVFIILQGMSTLKRKFCFAQGNNISRKSFIKGIVLSIFPIAMTMAIIDLFINRAVNAFIKMPSFYDTMIGNDKEIVNWVQDNSIGVMLNTIVLLFAIYCMCYILGLVINIIFYNKTEVGELIVITILIFAPKVLRNITDQFNIIPYEINNKIKESLNISDSNMILELLSYSLIFIILYFVANLLIKKIIVKNK